MGIEEFKRWHWIVLGALVGVALAYAWSTVGSNVEGYRAVDSFRFEQEITIKDDATGLPLIKGIIAPEESFDGKVNIVTYKRLAKDKDGRVGWLDKRMIAKIPYRDGIASVQEFLKSSSVKFNDGWWLKPRWAMIIGSVGGMVLIGGIWPSLLNVMLGAGFGRQRDPEEEARKKAAKSGFEWGSLLRRAKSAQPAHAPVGASADASHVQDVADAYARNLQGSGAAHTGATGSTAVADAQVKKLEGGPLEAAKPMPKPGDDDEIEVKGEYYPVLIHHHKKKEGDAAPPPPKPEDKKD
jgi:hypothetical protein